MLLKVEQGEGHKDRFAMLSPQLLELVGAEAGRLPTSFLKKKPVQGPPPPLRFRSPLS